MGYTNIPPNPTAAGQVIAQIELDEPELHQTVRVLRGVMEHARASTSSDTAPALANHAQESSAAFERPYRDLALDLPDTLLDLAFDSAPSAAADMSTNHAINGSHSLFGPNAFGWGNSVDSNAPDVHLNNLSTMLANTVLQDQPISSLDPEVPDFRVTEPRPLSQPYTASLSPSVSAGFSRPFGGGGLFGMPLPGNSSDPFSLSTMPNGNSSAAMPPGNGSAFGSSFLPPYNPSLPPTDGSQYKAASGLYNPSLQTGLQGSASSFPLGSPQANGSGAVPAAVAHLWRAPLPQPASGQAPQPPPVPQQPPVPAPQLTPVAQPPAAYPTAQEPFRYAPAGFQQPQPYLNNPPPPPPPRAAPRPAVPERPPAPVAQAAPAAAPPAATAPAPRFPAPQAQQPPPPPPTYARQLFQPPPPPRQATQPQGRQPPPPPPRHGGATPAAPRTQQPELRAPPWQVCWTTAAEDHNSDMVQAMAYCPTFEGLPGGDGHGGWLISSSRHLLNLWECSAGGGKGQPSLQLMHSQMTDFLSSALSIEGSSQMMFAASVDTRQGSECVSVHSLSAEAGFLAYKYRFILSDDRPPRGKTGSLLQQVVTLHPLGHALQNCCAASCGGKIFIFEIGSGSSSSQQRPRAEWKAHESAVISVLHRSSMGTSGGASLFSGASDGSIHMWNLKDAKPQQPMRKFAHTQAVTGVQQVNEHLLVTSAQDSKPMMDEGVVQVMLWDLRNAAAAMKTITPDGSPVLRLAVSPVGDCVAVATTKGLYAVDLIDQSGTVSPIAEKLPKPYSDIVWNSNTWELYACGAGGLITVLRQR